MVEGNCGEEEQILIIIPENFGHVKVQGLDGDVAKKWLIDRS